MHFSFLLDTLAAVLIQMSFSEWGLLIDPGPGGSDGVLKQGAPNPRDRAKPHGTIFSYL